MPNNRPDPQRTGELCATLARAFPEARPGPLAVAVLAAQRAARTAKRRAEFACSFDEGEALATKRDKREMRACVTISEALARAGVPGVIVSLGGDPRGPCGYLQVPGLPGDGWAQDRGFPLY